MPKEIKASTAAQIPHKTGQGTNSRLRESPSTSSGVMSLGTAGTDGCQQTIDDTINDTIEDTTSRDATGGGEGSSPSENLESS